MERNEPQNNPEQEGAMMEVEPAEEEFKKQGLENCILINPSEDGDVPDFNDLVRLIGENGAVVAGEGNEEIIDSFLIRFPGKEQQLYSEDDVQSLLRALEDQLKNRGE